MDENGRHQTWNPAFGEFEISQGVQSWTIKILEDTLDDTRQGYGIILSKNKKSSVNRHFVGYGVWLNWENGKAFMPDNPGGL